MLRINSIKITPCEKFRFNDKDLSEPVYEEIKRLALKKLKIPVERLLNIKIKKQSIDARKKDDVKVIFSIDVNIKDENGFIKRNRDKDIVYIDNVSLENSKNIKTQNDVGNESYLQTNDKRKIIVVGAGPAGLFCALKLAEAGLKPILLERGEDVDKRIKSVSGFWQGKPLNPSSNVQFGEGGAGTFSDGKLNTMVKDIDGRMSEVYKTFVQFGADESILYINKPHIGTDRLTEIVKGIRNKIIELGGEVRFSSQVVDIITDESNIRRVSAVVLSNGETIECDDVILALGHSARDTFEMLAQKGIAMEQKPFAMGVRVQHPCEYIDSLQYGRFHEFLPAADYKLTYTQPNERSVYSFCMCPGGYVVNASSENGRLAVNGMSYSGRDSEASNSAIVVQINTSDFPGEDVLAGIRLQRRLEEDAFKVSNGKIPVQSLQEFSELYLSSDNIKILNEGNITKNNTDNIISLFDKNYFESMTPVCKGEWEYADLNAFLPKYMSSSILKAFPYFGTKMKGFDSGNTLLLGLESRTSSPVRIIRGEDLQSINCKGLYPCGEGAGYAGGITSAAMDGLKVANSIIGTVL